MNPIEDLAVELRIRNNQLLQRRKELGLSQRKMAEAVGIPFTDYVGLESLRQPSHMPVQKTDRCIVFDCDGVLRARGWYCSTHRRATRNQRMRWLADYGQLALTAWSDSAMALANFFCVEPCELFPETINAIKTPVATRLVDACDVPALAPVSQGTLQLAASPAEKYEAVELRNSTMAVLDRLTDREQLILKARTGLDGGGGKTLEEIAITQGVNRERIRQIEAKAYRKLRHPSMNKYLRPFIDGDWPKWAETSRQRPVRIVDETDSARVVKKIVKHDTKTLKPLSTAWKNVGVCPACGRNFTLTEDRLIPEHPRFLIDVLISSTSKPCPGSGKTCEMRRVRRKLKVD